MRLPQQLLDSLFFSFETLDELLLALGSSVDEIEIAEISRLSEARLPPITSHHAIAVMIGINPGLAWSLERNPRKFYREFEIPKGKSFRKIQAPKVALKIIQKWISVHIQRQFAPPNHVFGFVSGKSHIDAAKVHIGADWILSIDIKDFFQSTPRKLVFEALIHIGYGAVSANLIANLSCFGDFLSQGSPCSPVISNICFHHLDREMLALSLGHKIALSRYADDIVFSGKGSIPDEILSEITQIISTSPWKIAEEKTEFQQKPKRLKVHGLLIKDENVRLTKGYRNRIRALRHLLKSDKIAEERIKSAVGHINYANQVERAAKDTSRDAL
jgi:RNA-directed DNA polymerase